MPIYMKYGEGPTIKGAVDTAGYEGWIELGSCQFGISRAMSTPTGKSDDREGSTPAISEIVITKTTDEASTGLFRASLGLPPAGEGQKVLIDFLKTDSGGKPEPYMQFELENTMVSSYSLSSGGDRPMESLSINFTKVTYNNISMGAANEDQAPDRASYDLAKQTGS